MIADALVENPWRQKKSRKIHSLSYGTMLLHWFPFAGECCWCCEISWNYLKCLYIIPEKWVHLGQKIWAFASICSALVHREQIFKNFVEKWIIQKFILSLSLSSKSSRSRSQIQVYRQKRSLFPCSFFMSYDLITVLFQNVALGYHRK